MENQPRDESRAGFLDPTFQPFQQRWLLFDGAE